MHTGESAGTHGTLPEQVGRLLAAGDVAEALTLSSQAGGSDRVEVAGMLVHWAAARAPATKAEAEVLANVYLVAAALDPLRNDVYPPLVSLVTSFRLIAPARQGASLWMDALRGDPARQGVPEFAAGSALGNLADLYTATDAADRNPKDLTANLEAARQCLLNGKAEEARQYAERARALGPRETEVLSMLADLGLLEPVSAETAVDVALPFRADGLGPVRGGKAVVTGYPEDTSVTCVVALPGGEVDARVEQVTSASLSPSGRYLAYATDADLGEPCEVLVLDLEVQETRLLLDTLGTVKGIEWSPDESSVAVSSMEGLVIVRADGADRRVVIPASRTGSEIDWTTWAFPHWLAGGRRVAAQKLGWEWIGEARVHDLETGETVVALRATAGQYEIGAVLWAPGGDKIAFAYKGYGAGDDWSAAIAAVGGDAAEPTIAVSGSVSVDPVGWSADGKGLVVRLGSHIWLYGLDSGELSLLPGDPWIAFPVCGDDGVIYFLSAEGERLVGVRPAGWR